MLEWAWIVDQGVRGKDGVEAAAEIISVGVPSWQVDACWVFCDGWEAPYRAAVQRTGSAAVFGHEENLAQGMSGLFVAACDPQYNGTPYGSSPGKSRRTRLELSDGKQWCG